MATLEVIVKNYKIKEEVTMLFNYVHLYMYVYLYIFRKFVLESIHNLDFTCSHEK